MKIFGLSDLHLSFTTDKAMDVFGPQWLRHWEKIEANWREAVSSQDVVLIPGDISWGMTFAEAIPDLAWLQRLPGRKVLSRGNHDYWWQGIGKMRQQWPDLNFIQNDALRLEGRSEQEPHQEVSVAVCGSRGWNLPPAGYNLGGDNPEHLKDEFSAQDEKIYLRELSRLEMALKALPQAQLRIAMLHYPPFTAPLSPQHKSLGFTALNEAYQVDICVYGHLHGLRRDLNFNHTLNGIRYQLISADYLDFHPLLLTEL